MPTATFVFIAIVVLGLGFLLGLAVHRYVWPTCPEDSCGRPLRCPRHEADTIRHEQVAAGPAAQILR